MIQRSKKLLDQVRDAIRLKHYAYSTEHANVAYPIESRPATVLQGTCRPCRTPLEQFTSRSYAFRATTQPRRS